MHSLYNDEIWVNSHCEDLMREAADERMLAKLKVKNKTNPYARQWQWGHVQVIIQQPSEDKELLTVEVR
jgi:hypothetical protein